MPSALQALRCQEPDPETAAETLLSKETILQVSSSATKQSWSAIEYHLYAIHNERLGMIRNASPRRSLVDPQMWALLQGKGNGVHKV